MTHTRLLFDSGAELLHRHGSHAAACRRWLSPLQVAGAILKFFPPTMPHATAMGCMEIAAYLSLAGVSGGASAASQLLYAGLLDTSIGDMEQKAPPEAAAAAAAAGQQPTPFLAIRKAQGVTLSSCMDALTDDQWMEVAAAAWQPSTACPCLLRRTQVQLPMSQLRLPTPQLLLAVHALLNMRWQAPAALAAAAAPAVLPAVHPAVPPG